MAVGGMNPVRMAFCACCIGLLLGPVAMAAETAARQSPVSGVVQAPADAIRRLGASTASMQADLVLDINCPHCADVFSSAMSDLGKHADAGTVEVVVRWWPRPRDPLASDLIGHVLATANRTEFRLLSSLVVGTPEGRGWLFLRSRLAELVDPPVIEERMAANKPAIDQVLQDDGRRIMRWSIKAVPCLILSDRKGAERGRWEGKQFDVAAAMRVAGAGIPSVQQASEVAK